MSRRDIVRPRMQCTHTRDPSYFRHRYSEEGHAEQDPTALIVGRTPLASEDLGICGSKLWLLNVV